MAAHNMIAMAAELNCDKNENFIAVLVDGVCYFAGSTSPGRQVLSTLV
jgi:hypothetical protein